MNRENRNATDSGVADGVSKRTSLRDNLESIAIAVVLVLFVRQLVVEAFKIPTGSMAPALVGEHREVRCPNCGTVFRVGHDKVGPRGEVICRNCFNKWPGAGKTLVRDFDDEDIIFRHPAWLWHQGRTAVSRISVAGSDAANRIDRWGSRIFVNKFIYRMRRPRRWELAVFDYPYGDQNYIKRIIGLPGETVAIRGGNIYINGEIARKPPEIQRQMWMDVLDTALSPRRELREWWDFGENTHRWAAGDGGALSLDARHAHSPLYARYNSHIVDFYAYNAYKNEDGRSGRNQVNEVKVEADISIDGAEGVEGSINFRVAGGKHDFVVSVPVGDGAEGEAVLFDDGGRKAAAASPRLEPGRDYLLAVERYDRQIVVKVDGEEVMRHVYNNPDSAHLHEQFIGLGAQGLRVVFSRVRLSRDIYYLPGSNDFGALEYKLSEESYFVLGDNSPYSSDSREWEHHRVPSENLIGRAFAVFWPISDIMYLPSGRPDR